MTGEQLYTRAIALLGLRESEVLYYRELAVECLNQLLDDHLWENNALCAAKGEDGWTVAPTVSALGQEIPYEEAMVRECFPYGLAALLIAEEDHEEYNRMNEEMERRMAYYSPCYVTDLEESG
ncbi:MAG: hypothetical protein ACI4PM_03685 [Butyricicoccus sp.]